MERVVDRESEGAPAPTTAPAVRAATTPAAAVLALQRAAGNAAVTRLLARTTYTPGVSHKHAPSGRWADVQANPDSGWKEELVCSHLSPINVVRAAIWAEFDDKPIAQDHLDWYLSKGGGKDYVEDRYVEMMLRQDGGVRHLIASLLPSPAPTSGKFATHVKVEQGHYAIQDLRFAFGAIDRLDIEVDYDAGTLKAWFMDFYEWHPYYPALYTAFPDDAARETNCVHAALVELKSGTAADFWMKGEATVPLSVMPAPGSPLRTQDL